MDNLHPNITVVGTYTRARAEVDVKCKICSHPWSPRACNLTTKDPSGCPKCGDKRSAKAKIGSGRTHLEYVNLLKRISPSITVIGTYTNAKAVIDVKCDKCDHPWTPIANSLITKRPDESYSGCPKCFVERLRILKRRPKQDFLDFIKIKGFRLLGDYVDTNIKAELECTKCSCKWSPPPTKVFGGTGCPDCARDKTAFQTYHNKPTYLYYIKIIHNNIIQYKVGVSLSYKNHKNVLDSVKRRYSVEYKNKDISIEILNSEFHEDGYNAYLNEQIIVRGFSNFRINKNDQILDSGYTETFTKDVIT